MPSLFHEPLWLPILWIIFAEVGTGKSNFVTGQGKCHPLCQNSGMRREIFLSVQEAKKSDGYGTGVTFSLPLERTVSFHRVQYKVKGYWVILFSIIIEPPSGSLLHCQAHLFARYVADTAERLHFFL